MSEKCINEAFVEALKSKIPKKTQLADFLVETLSIEKETAYRRLRSVTMFTFNEIAILAKKLNFSVDEIIINAEKEIPFTNMMLHSVYSENEGEMAEWEAYSNDYVEEYTKEPYSEFGMALKNIPLPLLLPYDTISRYYKFKYAQHANNPSHLILFKDIDITDEKKKNLENSTLTFQYITQTIYIWDRKIIPTIVDDVKYFQSLGTIDKEEVKQLKKELLSLMNDLENTAAKGKFESSGNKVDIYISDEDIDSTYAYLWSDRICFSTLITHLYYAVMSYNNKTKCKEMMDWITSMKHNSILISWTGGRERVSFFNKQREVINTL